MSRSLLVAGVAAAALHGAHAKSSDVWPPSAYAAARAMLAKMTLQDKLQMAAGTGKTYPYVGIVPGNSRQGIPSMGLEDGPQGVADGATLVTAWPSALTVVTTWDNSLMFEFGRAMAEEQFSKGSSVMLGPGVNLARVPWGGRNFEYQGEDPVLAGEMVAAEVSGIQSVPGILACVKHFVGNNQEFNRNTVSANVGERALRELYYAPFAAAVDAGVGSAMCSYNRINNTYACQNNHTIGWLKDEAGFDGWVMSDWGATHSTAPSALAGLDQQMPDSSYFGSALAAAVAAGTVPASRIDDLAMRMLTPMYAYGLFANPPNLAVRNITAPAGTPAHAALARQLAEASTVLLKNNAKALPLDPGALRSIGVFGDATTVTGGGSGGVVTPYIITPVQGITNYLANNAPGTGNNVTVKLWNNTADPGGAASLAKTVDVAVVVVATSSHEGADRTNLSLPAAHDALVAAVATANPRTVVVVRCPGACVMPWIDAVPAILLQMMPGQEAGNALANVLFGAVNPSGKLPVTFPTSINDTWLSTEPGGPWNPEQYPGTDRGNGWLEADYTEELLFGYRWHDAVGVKPLFPFGHGLSYTTFSYADILITGSLSASDNSSSVTVSATVKNTGVVAGAEVVQLYVSHPAAAGEPPKVLKGFLKLFLAPDQTETAAFTLYPKDVRTWDTDAGRWTVPLGDYGVALASSSVDIRLTGGFVVSD